MKLEKKLGLEEEILIFHEVFLLNLGHNDVSYLLGILRIKI